MNKQKNFFKKILWLFPIPIFIVGVNYFVQTTEILKNNAHDAAEYLLAGYNIANAYTCGDSCIKEFYAKNVSQKKDILVFGSSRSLGIKSNLFPGKSFFNMSVTDGRLENFIYLYLLWRDKAPIPSHVVLGLDAWLLKSKSQNFLWPIIKDKFVSIDADFSLDIGFSSERFALPADYLNQNWEFVQRLCSIDLFRNYLMYTLNYLLHIFGFKGLGSFYPTKENFAVAEVMLSDGSINYGLVRRSRSAEEVERIIISDIKEKGFFHLNDFSRLNEDMIKLFELFIRLLVHDNVIITFFLTPYHPKAFELLKASEKYNIICLVRNYFTDFAKRNGIKVVGDFDPEVNRLDGSDFFDEFHPKGSAMQKVFD